MKRILAILFSMFIAFVVLAQSPIKLSYQAVIRNSSNQLVTNHAVGMKISILQGTSTGTVVYSETLTPTTNANGLVSIEFGGGTGFDAINWANGPYFIKTETDPTGGTTYSITGTSQLLTVPYSLFAKTSGNGLTTADIAKLAGIAAGAEVNVNADWNATSGDAQILNKPTLATIATTGSYNDLSNKPTTDGSETKVTAGTNVTVTGLGTTASPYIVNSTASGSGPSGTAIGDMLYWNGTAWQILPKGSNGQVLVINSNIPTWYTSQILTITPPTATTLAATNVQGFSVTLNGTVNPKGFLTHVEFEYGLTADYGNHNGSADLEDEITGIADVAVSINVPTSYYSDESLEPATTYHYRITAGNSEFETFGNDMTFTTPVSAPLVKTTDLSNITATSADCGGSVIHFGGADVTARGVCWSTSSNPTTALSTKTIDGTGTGDFTSSLTGLTTRTTYYIRAYATNSIGTSYGAEQVFFTGVGTSYQGGIIAYIFRPGDPGYVAGQTHGLIAAPTDQSTGIQWYNGSYTSTGATATAIGTGQANTTAIITSQGNTGSYAAKLCQDLVLGGYSDWYLPSIKELSFLRDNLYRSNLGDFQYDDYWSSSEYGNLSFAFTVNMGSSGDNFYPKYKLCSVRAVRTF